MRFLFSVFLVPMAVANLYGQQPEGQQNDPPARVARLNHFSGVVSFQPAGEQDWVEAPLNRPLISGDHFWADDGSRAEFHVGSTALRIGAQTGFSFFNVDDMTTQVRLSQGVMELRVRNLDETEVVEIDTPNVAFSVLRPGDYRIEVDASGQTTTITVRTGQGEASQNGQSFPVRPRERARVMGIDRPTYDIFPAARPDDFDFWCQDRDQREERSESVRYVSREVIGYEDLDANGSWREAPEYGMVWYPRTVSPGWAPYRYGHWAWIEPWGWTWVDDAPWGFAPFHYGRWAYVGGGWGWIPGPVSRRPVYAPALVAWVGGPRASLSISIGGGGGGVAWFPLGPGEVFVPAYRTTPRYFSNVNVTNTRVTNVQVTNVYNTTVINNNMNVVNNTRYINRGAPGGITAVSQDTFVRSRPVHQGLANVNVNALQSAPVSTTSAIAPTRQSVFAGSSAAQRTPPAAVMNRQVVARTPPPPAPVPFNTRRDALQADPGRPLAREQMQQIRQRQPNAEARPLVRQMPAVRSDAGSVQAPQAQSPAAIPQVDRGRRDAGRPVEGAFPNPAQRQQQIERQRPVEQATPQQQQQQVPQPVERPRVERQRPVEQATPQTPQQVPQPVERPRLERQRPVEQATPQTPQQVPQPVERPRVERQRPLEQTPQQAPQPVERPRVERTPPAERPQPQERNPEAREQRREERKTEPRQKQEERKKREN